MPWIGGAVAGGISAVGSIGSGLIGAGAASSAANAQVAAQRQALSWIQGVYGNTKTNLQPFIGTGQSALSQLSGFYGLPGGNASGATQAFQQFQNTPSYQFPLQQANLGANRSLAASGLTGSPGAISRTIGQQDAGYASQGLGQYLTGLGGLAGGGQSAASSLGQIGQQTGTQVQQGYTNIGNAQAQGIYNSATSLTGALNALTGAPTAGGQGYGQSSYGNIGGGYGGFGNGAIGQIGNGIYNYLNQPGGGYQDTTSTF